MESTPSHAQSGTASKARARAMSGHTMIGSLGKRSTSTPANRPKSANGSASSAVRTPISSGVASSSRAPVSGRARKVICPPKWVMVSEPHSRTKSPWRHRPFNARMGLVRRWVNSARSIPIHRSRTRFVRAIGRFVASPLPGVRRVLNLHAKGGIAMRRGIRLMALGIAALRELEAHAPDVLFLDIQMPGLTGLEVARQASGRCHIVFVTAYDQHTLAAFEQGAADYVLKPASAARLATTVARLKERIGRPAPAIEGLLRELGAPQRGFLRWINASQGQTVHIITVEDICYFQADSKYTRVVTAEGESLIRKPIKELSQELDPASFWQIHRSTIVNVHAIAGVVRDLRGHTQVRLKRREELLAVSDAYTPLFRQM